MSFNLISKTLCKNYSKYCLPILFFIIVLIVVLFLSYNNMSTDIINTLNNDNLEMISEIRFDFVGSQLLNFVTFLLACILPVFISLIMGTYEKSSNTKISELSINQKELFTTRTIIGSIFIIIPFIVNALLYVYLFQFDFFGSLQGNMISKLVTITIFGVMLSMLSFMLMTIINIALKNSIIDAIITLAVTIFIVQVFNSHVIKPFALILIILFIWFALAYWAYNLNKNNELFKNKK